MIDPRRIEVLDERVAEILRGKTIAERVALISSSNQTMRLRLEGHLRTQYPTWTSAQIQAEIAHRMSHGAT